MGLETLEKPLSIYLTSTDLSFIENITDHHVFLGYKPLIITIAANSSDEANWLMRQERVCFSFMHGSFTGNYIWNGFVSDRNAIARLLLKKIGTKELGGRVVFIFEGEFGEHKFLLSPYQMINRVREKLRHRHAGNINLPGSLYDQVCIAYGIPRNISIITLTDRDKMNMFPTDLHGPVTDDFYMSSLRIGGKANEQVEQAGLIALSRVKINSFKEVYDLGRNHMANPERTEKFKLSSFRSKEKQIPLPESLINYRELKRINSFDVGIHRIHFYETLYRENAEEGVTLAHIHRYYAQWRLDRKLPTKTYFR